MILIITVFTVSSAESIIEKPSLIIPLITITLVAVILGVGVERYKFNAKISSAIAIIIIFASLWLGEKIPISPFIISEQITRIFWISLIMIYAFVASILPVWILLRPRDFLSSIQLVLTLLLDIYRKTA